MSTEFKHLPVNWIDGMKISRKHFQQTESFLTEQIMDTNALHLTKYNFGILPGERSLFMDVQCDFSQQITIELTNCDAVTPDGSRIFIVPDKSLKYSTNFKEIAARYSLPPTQAQKLYILLSINSYNRIPFGEPWPDENPPRHPFTIPDWKLDILPEEQIRSNQLDSILIIGKINYANGELLYQRDFIPPCTSAESLQIVRDWYNRFRSSIASLEASSSRIIDKIKTKKDINLLTTGMHRLAENMIYTIAGIRTQFRWMAQSAPPVFMCEALLRVLQNIHSTYLCFSSFEREEVINYFTEWTDFQQGVIDRQLGELIQMEYSHYNLHQIFTDIYQAYVMYQQIFEKMVTLEYIGKHKGDGKIFIDQKVELPGLNIPAQQNTAVPKTEQPKRPSFLG